MEGKKLLKFKWRKYYEIEFGECRVVVGEMMWISGENKNVDGFKNQMR